MVLSAVVTTGIYCRPGCPGRPDPANVVPYDHAAAAEAAGFRACLRCRPYRTSGLAPLTGPEVVCRAVQLISAGALDGSTEDALAARVGTSARHLRRLFSTHVGATPDQLARSRRAHFARRLLDDTDLTVTEVAFASGFGSVRQMNRTLREVFRAAPTELRVRRRVTDRLVADGGLALRLPFDGPLDVEALLAFMAPRAIPGVEHVGGGAYRRTIVVDGDPGVIELRAGGDDHVVLVAHLPHWEGLIHVVDRARRILALDAPIAAAAGDLAADPVIGPLVGARPGIRPAGTWDPFETGVRAILGQQVSVAGATTLAGRLAARLGRPVPGLDAFGLSCTFPDAATVAGADLAGIGLTAKRAEAVRAFATAVAAGDLRLDGSPPLDATVAALSALPGVGPWTAHYLALRLGETDAFPATDLGLRTAYRSLTGTADMPASLAAAAEPWRPWRAVAAVHLWAAAVTPPDGSARRERAPSHV